MRRSPKNAAKTVCWHRELPPLNADVICEDEIEANSDRVRGAIVQHGELWQACYNALMEHTQERLEQELSRLRGDYAHIHDEHIDSHRDDASGESWLHGRFHYVLYRRTGVDSNEAQ
jgi:hypothetical protein